MEKGKFKKISDTESEILLNEVVDTAKTLEQKLRRLFPGILLAKETSGKIWFESAENTSVDSLSAAVRMIHEGVRIVEKVSPMKTEYNQEVLPYKVEGNEEGRFKATDEYKQTVAALRKRIGENIAVKQEERLPGQHW